jgi:hypothetical protein
MALGSSPDGRTNPQKRFDFIAGLDALLKGSSLQPVGATLPLSVYRLFHRSYCVEEAIGTPYTYGRDPIRWTN